MKKYLHIKKKYDNLSLYSNSDEYIVEIINNPNIAYKYYVLFEYDADEKQWNKDDFPIYDFNNKEIIKEYSTFNEILIDIPELILL